jgi:hypothetical protein
MLEMLQDDPPPREAPSDAQATSVIHISPLEQHGRLYIALRFQVASELDIIAIWCFMFLGSHKPHQKIGAYVDTQIGPRPVLK